MSKFKWFLVLVLLIAISFVFWKWDSEEPEVDWLDTAEFLSRDGQIHLRVSDSGNGLAGIEVVARQEDRTLPLFNEEFKSDYFPWPQGPTEREVMVPLADAVSDGKLTEGVLDIEVTAWDQPNLVFFNSTIRDVQQRQLDRTAPRVEVLSGNHYIRQGGSEAVVYRVNDPDASSGVQVGERTFPGFPIDGGARFLCLFPFPYNQDPATKIFVWAEDQAGNRRQASFYKEIIPVRFRKRDIQVSDRLIEQVAEDILANTPEVARKETLRDTFFELNNRLRKLNHDKIAELSGRSSATMLWERPFLQLTNSQVEAFFADERTYFYQGEVVDQQTHQGYDLASLARSPVESSNDGQVVWADYLGIYGNCVIVDHGLGLMSLYGHLSAFEIAEGETVVQGQSLGRTGQTGMAAGDHLHFTMLLHGIQVNPLEWWDPKWVERHVRTRLETQD
jgi:murein DD-endopeptidase MepM/ murein hydrolase activator NlpD